MPEHAEPVPLKTSVTSITQHHKPLSDEDSEETLEDKRKTEEAVRTFRLSSAPTKPAFLEDEKRKVEATSIGTATHRFMHLINLDELRKEGADEDQTVHDEMARMRAEHIMSEDEANMIRIKGPVSFFRSELGRRMLASSEVRREVDFTMKMDPHHPTLIQGIIDCVFKENGEWILIDYKTDRDTAPETFIPRHEMQMNWYRAAIERLTRIKVKEMWLFALQAGKAFPVERRDV